MAEWGVCKELIKTPRRCSYCGIHHCQQHQLPENHDCDALTAKNLKHLESDGPSTRGLSKHARQHERVRSKRTTKTKSRQDDTGREESRNRRRRREKPPEQDKYQCPNCKDYFYIRRACKHCDTRFCSDCRNPKTHHCPKQESQSDQKEVRKQRSGYLNRIRDLF